MTVDELSEVVIGCGIAVHTAMGPGLLESICRDCLVIELVANGLLVEVERRVPVFYREQRVRDDLKIDLLVEGQLVVEVKCVEQLYPVHAAQVITYLKLSGFPAGLLMNFNVTSLRAGLRRLDHPEIYKRKREERMARAKP
jgi:GxxExxY protein